MDATRFHTKNWWKFAFQNCLKFAYFCFCFVQFFLWKSTKSCIKIRDPTIQVRLQVLGAAWAVVKWSKLGSWGPSQTCWRRWVEPLGEDWGPIGMSISILDLWYPYHLMPISSGILLNWWIHDFLIYWQVLFKCKHPAESFWSQDASANQRGTTCSCLNFCGIYLLFRHLFCLLR